MPNWCENRLEIQGNAADIAAIVKLARCDEKLFDFEGIVPMPKTLQITCGSSTDHGFEVLYGDWKSVATWLSKHREVPAEEMKSREELIALIESEPDKFRLSVSLEAGRQAKANLDRFGHKTWYSWRVEHWGTKWNTDEGLDVSVTETSIAVSFDTAWSPPIPVIASLCERFPGITLQLRYYEPGMCYGGTVCGEAGCVTDVGVPDCDLNRFAEEHFGAVFDDDEEEDAEGVV